MRCTGLLFVVGSFAFVFPDVLRAGCSTPTRSVFGKSSFAFCNAPRRRGLFASGACLICVNCGRCFSLTARELSDFEERIKAFRVSYVFVLQDDDKFAVRFVLRVFVASIDRDKRSFQTFALCSTLRARFASSARCAARTRRRSRR